MKNWLFKVTLYGKLRTQTAPKVIYIILHYNLLLHVYEYFVFIKLSQFKLCLKIYNKDDMPSKKHATLTVYKQQNTWIVCINSNIHM